MLQDQMIHQLAKEYHPDRNQGDAECEHKFKEISAAYEILKDDEKRAAYDQFGHAAFDGSGQGGGFSGSFADVFDDLFGDFMGGQRGRSQATRGADLRYNLEISIEEAYAGKTTNVRVPTSVSCEECDGSGAAPGTAPKTCPTCQGHGKVRSQQGFFTIERTCPACNGAGQVIAEPCGECRGAGRVQQEKNLSVNIPAGIDDGNRIRLAGEGEAGVRGGPPGDLYIFLSVRPHELFQRDGAHIYCRVPIDMVTATLGGEIEVPNLNGSRVRVSIPAGTQAGRQFRLKGKGMPVIRSAGYGDMLVQTVVETPVNLSKRQRELLREFAGEKDDNSPESAGFFAKVKELWEELKE